MGATSRNWNLLHPDTVETRQPRLRGYPEITILGLNDSRDVVPRQSIIRLPAPGEPRRRLARKEQTSRKRRKVEQGLETISDDAHRAMLVAQPNRSKNCNQQECKSHLSARNVRKDRTRL
jgi:hypothetical protein